MQEWGAALYGDEWADVYDELYPADEPVVGECVEFVVSTLAEGPAGDVMELGIGTGRMALPLAGRLPPGVRLHGMDSSRVMLDVLAAKPGSEDICTHEGDFGSSDAFGRELDNAFAVVFVPFSTFFALPDQASQIAGFENVSRLLRSGGRFCLETFVPDQTMWRHGQSVVATDIGPSHVLLGAMRHDPVGQTIESQHIHVTETGTRLRPVRIRYAWPAELDLMARLAGLDLDARYADWRRSPFTADSSRHLSVYVRR